MLNVVDFPLVLQSSACSYPFSCSGEPVNAAICYKARSDVSEVVTAIENAVDVADEIAVENAIAGNNEVMALSDGAVDIPGDAEDVRDIISEAAVVIHGDAAVIHDASEPVNAAVLENYDVAVVCGMPDVVKAHVDEVLVDTANQSGDATCFI